MALESVFIISYISDMARWGARLARRAARGGELPSAQNAASLEMTDAEVQKQMLGEYYALSAYLQQQNSAKN